MPQAPSQPLPDESDADVTSQFLAAERTATDLQPVGADATGEIEAIDIIEVVNARRTSRLAAVVVNPLLPACPPPASPSSRAAHPTSIAPMAIDVAAPRVSFPSVPSWSPTPTATTTMQLARAAGVPALSARFAVIATSVFGMCLIAGTVGAVLGYARVSQESVASGAPAPRAPRSAVVLGALEEITEPAITASAKAASTQEPAAIATVIAPAPATTTHATVTSQSRRGTGVLHVVGAVSGALVDGTPHRVANGAVTVACGRHRVKLPGRSVRVVDVPCGGSTTF